jgi:uncharacterized membrane protein YbhN (UPF0104 family)
MRLGEGLFPWLMYRYFGYPLLTTTATLLWLRLMDLHVLILVGYGVLWWQQEATDWWWFGLLAVWVFFLPFSIRLCRRLVKKQPSRLLQRLIHSLATASPNSHLLLIRLYSWTLLSWFVKLIAFTVILHHFIPVALWQVLSGVLSAELSSILPFHGVAGAGSYEAAVLAMLVPLDIAIPTAITGAVNLHLFMLGGTVSFALLMLLVPKNWYRQSSSSSNDLR